VRIDSPFQRGAKEIFRAFGSHDLYVVNFESAVRIHSDADTADKSVPIEAALEDAERFLDSVGSSRLLLNLANNHSRDAGEDNARRYRRWFQDRGVLVIDDEESLQINVNGSTIQISTFGKNTWPYCANRLKAAHSAYHVVLLHWGEEYVYQPHPKQRSVARELVARNVDLIVGSHPHVMQGSEIINNSRVYYSLGNTVFGFPGMPPEARLGSVLSLTLEQNNITTEIIPLRIETSGNISRISDPNLVVKYDEFLHELSNNIEVSSVRWRSNASIPFINNHMSSWRKRLSYSNYKTWLIFFKECTSVSYIKMYIGLIVRLFYRADRCAMIAKYIVEQNRSIDSQ
jgi:hypothetical protein